MMKKKAVSPLIGYVLLIVGVLVLSTIVFNWLKTYVPSEGAECPEGSSLFVKNIQCSNVTDDKIELKLTIQNNGRFNLDGFFIRGTNDTAQRLATIDLVQYLPGRSPGVEIELFNQGRSALKPNGEANYIFTINRTKYGDIETIEVIPTRFDIIDGKRRFTSCGNAKVEQIVNCVQ